MRVLIAVPTFENITPDTFKAIYDMDKAGHQCDFEFVRGYDCATARNNIVKRTQEGNYDAVMMVDNDVVVPRDALVNLSSHGMDVVSGYYLHRPASNIADGKTCVCRVGEYNFTDQITDGELKALAANGVYLLMIHGGGMGCILIRRSVFDRYQYPWFYWTNYPDGGVLSEDLYFCVKCGELGIPICVDTRVACGHLMRHMAWPGEYVYNILGR